ncbi:MAG: hypothetical protein Q8N08_05145 [Methanobacteriaceae archaeon]|nr:hypothetical protein [Methanobacteriaceae archaeon]
MRDEVKYKGIPLDKKCCEIFYTDCDGRVYAMSNGPECGKCGHKSII